MVSVSGDKKVSVKIEGFLVSSIAVLTEFICLFSFLVVFGIAVAAVDNWHQESETNCEVERMMLNTQRAQGFITIQAVDRYVDCMEPHWEPLECRWPEIKRSSHNK